MKNSPIVLTVFIAWIASMVWVGAIQAAESVEQAALRRARSVHEERRFAICASNLGELNAEKAKSALGWSDQQLHEANGSRFSIDCSTKSMPRSVDIHIQADKSIKLNSYM